MLSLCSSTVHFLLHIPGIFFLTREDLRKLFDSLNKWKNELKQNGILIDGRHYHVKFKGTFCSYN